MTFVPSWESRTSWRGHSSAKAGLAASSADQAAEGGVAVPGEPDPGQLRDLLAAQARRAPPAGRRQADLLRGHALAVVAQELGELVAARGWWCESQDRSPSCPAPDGSAGWKP